MRTPRPFSFKRASTCLVNLLCCLLIFPHVLLVVGHDTGSPHNHFDTPSSQVTATMNSFYITQDANGCTTQIHDYAPLLHKPKYKVGVYSSEGDDLVFEMYNRVFAQYLTATVGRKFDPPISFEVEAVDMAEAMDLSAIEALDFIFASSAVYSCMATERKAQALVTIINRRQSRGYQYDLDVYGGVMLVLADNHEINTIADFKGKTIGAGSITAMGGGQTQFYEMFRHGLSYVADPKQVVFTKDERLVIQGLLDRDFDVAFARTDQMERHVNPDGTFLKEENFKIINPQTHVLDDGKLFPFVSSTSLHPEWPFASLDHVDKVVSKEVQEALLAIQDHALAATNPSQANLHCETTPELAQLALSATKAGAFYGFRTARSYFGVRTRQEVAGFMAPAEPQEGEVLEVNNLLTCVRGDSLYHDIKCPVQYYKISEELYKTSCERKGLTCKTGYECFCEPCIKAFEVDVYQYVPGEDDTDSTPEGCPKMSLCGQVQQTKPVSFRILDNLERIDPHVEVVMHWGSTEIRMDVEEVPNANFTYQFTWSHSEVGVGIMEIFVDGGQIPESPIRIQVIERDCDVDFPGRGMLPDGGGTCICSENTISIGHKCVESSTLAISLSVVILFFLCCGGIFYMQHRHRKGDEVWQVNIDELHFDQPVETIGQGSFGVVLKAEYRGTKVAIKRALKSKRTESKGTLTKLKDGLHLFGMSNDGSNADLGDDDEDVDLEASSRRIANSTRMVNINRTSLIPGDSTRTGDVTRSVSAGDPTFSLGFLDSEFGGHTNKLSKMFPWSSKNVSTDSYHQSVAFSATGSASHMNITSAFCPWFDANARQREEFKAEMRILSRLRHPAITTVMGAVFTQSHDPMLVMEYMEYGSLHDLLRNETMVLSGEIVLQMARDLAQGMRFLHTSKPPILHGDLKARNILVDNKFRAKICDFGLSTKRRAGQISGTPFWLPPEYLRGEKAYDTTCDMYSIGIIFFEIFARKAPYEGEDFKEVLRGVCNRGENKRPEIPSNTPPKFVTLMKKCWSPDAQYRPRAMDLDLTLIEMSPNDAELIEEGDGEDNKLARAGEMLNELFPKHVAEALRKGQKVEPESHELVTIIFSDIIHFTDISRTISPEKVCDMLDRLYHSFDFCARKHKVFKVETIGDAYMGVTNLESDQADTHVKHIAEFAVDMVNEATKIMIDSDNPDRGYINIRVGFHSGPVVSNVIGSLNKRYGLFGDSVNTASRMESNSTANRILCSERSCKLLRRQAPKMMIKKRGKIHVKGKGEMTTYWVGDNLLNKDNSNKSFRRSIDFFQQDSGEFTSPEAAPTPVQSQKSLQISDDPSQGESEAGRSSYDDETTEDLEETDSGAFRNPGTHHKAKKRMSKVGLLD